MGRRARKKEETRKLILEKAIEFFSSNPYNDVHLEKIADAVDVSRITVHNYIKEMDENVEKKKNKRKEKIDYKEELLYIVGYEVFKAENKYIEENLPSSFSGKDQFLFLINRLFENSINNKIYHVIVREYFQRLKGNRISSEEIYEDLIKKLGKDVLEKLRQGKLSLEDMDLDHAEKQYIQFLKNAYLWINVVQKGKNDGSIKSNLPDMYIIQYVNVLIHGMIFEMENKWTALERIKMGRDFFITNTIMLISQFLDGHSIAIGKDQEMENLE